MQPTEKKPDKVPRTVRFEPELKARLDRIVFEKKQAGQRSVSFEAEVNEAIRKCLESEDSATIKKVDKNVSSNTIEPYKIQFTDAERPIVELLVEILHSGDGEIISAICSNLSAFVRLIRAETAAQASTPEDSARDTGALGSGHQLTSLPNHSAKTRRTANRKGGS